MNRRGAWLGGALLMLLLVAAGLYLMQHLHSQDEVIERGPSAEARQDPFLAAQAFLRKRGIGVHNASGLQVLQSLPAQGNSLLLLGERGRMSARQVDQVLGWVKAGGRLLFVAEALWDDARAQSGDLLLDRLQLHQLLSDELPQLPSSKPDSHPELTRLYLENERLPAYFSFDPAFHLEDPANKVQAWANSSGATHLMQLRHGAGLITVVTDAELWNNYQIARYDNAWLLWYLNQGTAVTLVSNAEQDSLLALLMRYFPQALAALALLTLFGLWHVAMRHGAMLPEPVLARRQLQEHLRASADFQLRHGGQQRLLRSLQQDISQRARRRYPGFEQLAVAEQWQLLARLAGQPTRAISHALAPPSGKKLSSARFCRQVAQLQTLRNAL